MDDNTPTEPTAGQPCGCTCELCAAGKHDECPTGTCSVKKQQTPEDTPGGDQPAA